MYLLNTVVCAKEDLRKLFVQDNPKPVNVSGITGTPKHIGSYKTGDWENAIHWTIYTDYIVREVVVQGERVSSMAWVG